MTHRLCRIIGKRGRPAAWIAWLIGLAPPLMAQADVVGAIGADGRTIALANGGAAFNSGYSALFTCPATLAFGPSSMGLAFVGGPNRLAVRLSERPAGYDVPELEGGHTAVPSRYRLTPRADPEHPPDLLGFSFGATAAPGLDWLRIGLTAYIPLTGVGRQFTHFADEREQYFTNTLHHQLYGDGLDTLQLTFGTAIRPFRWLALGVGMRLLPASQTDTFIFMPSAVDQTRQEMNLRVTTGFTPGVIAGLALRSPGDRWRLAVTFRDQVSMTVQGQAEVQVKGFEGTAQYPFYQPMHFNVSSTPRQLVLAAGIKLELLTLSADLTWSEWSQYRDDHDRLAGFEDTAALSLGAELRPWGRLHLRGGFGYRPTPVPAQTGRTNYVDNDMLVLALGGSYDLDVLANNLEVGGFAQLQLASPTRTEKRKLPVHQPCSLGVDEVCDEVPDQLSDPYTGEPYPQAAGLQTGNPGFPGFSSGGWLLALGLELIWRYQ